MKIAFLNIYNGIVNRGAETFVKELASRLASKHKVTVFQAGDKEGFERYEVEKININFESNRGLKSFFILRRLFLDYQNRSILVFTLKSLPKILKEKYDVVVPVNGGWMPAIIRIATWLYGGKMVISGQSGIGWDDRNNLWCFPDVFVALSTYSQKWAKKANPFVKVTYIPNGVDTNKFKDERKANNKNERKTILAVGAFVSDKRLNLAIDAIAKIKEAKLIIAGGGGDLKEEIFKYGMKKLGKDRFEVLSASYEQMPEIYQMADVFTLPSRSSEAFGNVLVEAMATGLPVVATNDPIRQEIVGRAGILVDPTDVDQYAKALKTALEKNWGNLPRKQAEKFGWDKVSILYEEIFKEISK